MQSDTNTSKNIVRPVYNLEFPSWCPDISIFGYRFFRVSEYRERVQELQHIVALSSEFKIEATTGKHAHTADVEIPHKEHKAVLEWSGDNNTALMDVLLLLSLFTGREVFALKPQNLEPGEVLISDPRIYQWGGILRCSIPYKKKPIEPDPFGYNIGFEEEINQIYELIRSYEWQRKYEKGYFLILAKMAFHRQTLESAFVQCWTIWEHLFAVLNRPWMSERKIRQIGTVEKISFLLVNYALAGEIDNSSRKRIEALAEIRNRLVHFGRFPTRGTVHDDAILFIRLTEFVIAKILDLSPSNVFNTIEHLEEYLGNVQK